MFVMKQIFNMCLNSSQTSHTFAPYLLFQTPTSTVQPKWEVGADKRRERERRAPVSLRTMEYSIEVDFSAADVQSLNEGGYSLCLSKGVVQSAVSNPLPLIWIAKQPFQDNVFTWTEQYNFYASDSSVQSGATIEQTSYTTEGISVNVPYQFISGAFQIGGAVQVSPTAYTLENDSGAGVILGVTQSAEVDGHIVSSPIFGQYVNDGLDVSYQPQETISIFLQRQASNAQCIIVPSVTTRLFS